MREKIFPGTVATADGRGFKRLPWQKAHTTRRDTGTLKQGAGVAELDPTRKTSPQSKAHDLAVRFVNHLRAKETLLGRPLTPSDLTDEEYQAFGAEFWLRGEPVTVADMKRVAAIYLEGIDKGAQKDPRWTPSGRGYLRPTPKQSKDKP